MRNVVIWVTLWCFVSTQTLAIAAPVDEAQAQAAGAAANNAAQGFLNHSGAAQVVPKYTGTPPETAYYGNASLNSAATARVLSCTGSNDPSCQAATGAINSASTARPAMGPYDDSLATVRAIADDPASQLGDLSTYYTGCTVASAAVPAGTERQLCKRYAGLGNVSCSRKLLSDVHTDMTCLPSTWIEVGTSNSGPISQVHAQVRCEPTRTDGMLTLRVSARYRGMRGYCKGAQTLDVPVSTVNATTIVGVLDRTSGAFCGEAPFIALQPGSGCNNGSCNYTVAFGNPTFTCPGAATVVVSSDRRSARCLDYGGESPADIGPATEGPFESLATIQGSFAQPAYSVTVRNAWDDTCTNLVANGGYGTCTPVTASTCVDGPSTKTVQGKPVFAECWEYRSTYSCGNGPTQDECAPLVSRGCTLSSSSCVQSVPGDTTACGIYQDTYQCPKAAGTTTQVSNCTPTQTAAEQPSSAQDFVRTVTYLEAAREAGRYLDPETMKVFKGFSGKCDRRLFGLVNCCKGGGSGGASVMNNLSMAQSAGTAYQAVFSTYTYDALFASSAPNWALTAFSTIAEAGGGAAASTGFSSAVAGLASGNITFMQFLSSLSWMWWVAVIIFIIQISGILDCPESSQVLMLKRDAHLCHDLGEYCSERLPVFNTCVKHTRGYCCFNSRLSRLINEQGRRQLGMSFGSAEHPRCDGFTIAQLQSLDFSRMDLTEFYAEIAPTLPSAQTVAAQQQQRATTCYYGQGKC